MKYGVNHLHTPLLIIVGHSNCGAVTAAMSDYSKLEPSIIQELNTLHLPKGLSNIDGVKRNVHNQFAFALKKFNHLVSEDKLLVVGAIYDFSNDLKKGAGEFVVINIQGKMVA